MQPSSEPQQPDRRDFLKKACCVALGGALAAVPVGAGVGLYLDPLTRKGKNDAEGVHVRVAKLDTLPADGSPRRFPILASRMDAWTKSPESPIGAVFLMRTQDAQQPVRAFNSACPHAGCFVEYLAQLPSLGGGAPGFLCPCHNSGFKLDGQIAWAGSPAARGLDELECSVQNDGDVWVKFQNFQAGSATKLPLGA